MDYLEKCINRYQVRKKKVTEYQPFSHMLEFDDYQPNRVYRDQARRVIQKVRETKSKVNAIWSEETILDDRDKARLAEEAKQDAIRFIDGCSMNLHTMYWLLCAIESDKYKDISRTLFHTLFSAPSKDFFQLISASKQPLRELVEDENGELTLYGVSFTKRQTIQGQECVAS